MSRMEYARDKTDYFRYRHNRLYNAFFLTVSYIIQRLTNISICSLTLFANKKSNIPFEGGVDINSFLFAFKVSSGIFSELFNFSGLKWKQ